MQHFLAYELTEIVFFAFELTMTYDIAIKCAKTGSNSCKLLEGHERMS